MIVPVMCLGQLLFYAIFSKIGIPGAFGWSIISLTVAVRLLLNPLYFKQQNLARQMEDIKPHLDKLNKKHKNDKKKLQEEQMKLYQKMGINPASGCLLAVLQIPVFLGLYRALSMFLLNGAVSTVAEKVNKIVYSPLLKVGSIDANFLWLNLGEVPKNFSEAGYIYLAIPVVTALLQYLQVTYTMPQKKSSGKKGKGSEDISSMMSGQMKFMFPLMIGYFSFIFPVGLALYWNVFSIFSLIQARKK